MRELAEETGLEGVCGPMIGLVERFTEGEHFVVVDHAVTLLDPTETPVAGDDASEAAWVPLVDLADWHLIDGLLEFLHDHDIVRTIT